MNLSTIGSTCSDPALGAILTIIKNILSFIQIIGPLTAIISLTIHFISLMSNPEDKKGLNKIKNSAIALVALFMIPFIVNAVMGLLDDSTQISDCWNNASTLFNTGANYISENNDDRSSIYSNSNKYENGEKKDNNTNNGNNTASRVVFIGDSRTVQMYAYLNNNWSGANYSSGGVRVVGSDIYVAEGSMGLDWMKSVGVPAAKQYFTSGTAIVILMGVNDLHNANNYIEYINSNAPEWTSKGSSLYYVSVNPCDGSYSNLNAKIQAFNTQLKLGLSNGIGWIDTISELQTSGIATTDGLHYDKSTYQKIYDYIKSKV